MIEVETLNAIAQQWGAFMWNRAIDSAWVLLLVGILWGLLRHRVSAQFGYCLFLLVLIKLVAPVQMPWPQAAVRLLRLGPTLTAVTSNGPSKSSAGTAVPSGEVPGPVGPVTRNETSPKQEPRHPLSATSVLMGFWLAMVALLSGQFLHTEWTTFRAIRRSDPVDLSAVGISLERLKRTVRLRRPVRVAAHPGVVSPVVHGLWSPTLLLPADFADYHDADQMRWILLHELAHIRRGDMLVKLFQKLVQFAFFFHPGVWVVNTLIDRQREFACDDTAVLGSNLSRADCGESFLHIVKRVNQTSTLMPAFLGIWSPNTAVRKRLMRILDSNRTPQSRLSWGAYLWLACVALLVLPFSGIAAPSSEGPTQVTLPAEPNNVTFPVEGYTQKGKQYLWKQSLSAEVGDLKTVLCLSRDGDVTVKPQKDAGKNTVDVQAVITVTPRGRLANDPNVQKLVLDLKKKIGVLLGKDDHKTPTPEDDTMTVQTVIPRKMPPDLGVGISLEVLMPAQLALQVISADGDTRATGLGGPVAIRTSDGDVTVSECRNAVAITSADGDVNVVSCAGSLELRGADGDVKVTDCAGPLDLKTADGDVRVQRCSKPVAIRVADGDITLVDVQAAITVQGNDGDIRVSFAREPADACLLRCQSGDIAIVMPKTAKALVDLTTKEGEVHLDAPGFDGTKTEHAAAGKVNGGGPAIKAQSQDGDVSLKLQ